MNWARKTQRFVSKGINLNSPVDLMPEGMYPFLKNVRSQQQGSFIGRAGLNPVNAAPLADLNVHSLFRLNDYVSQDFLRFLGAGTNLYAGNTAPTAIDSGYSGNPLSVVAYTPLQSVSDWAYFADSNKLSKANSSGTVRQVGITPPTIIPTAELLPPAYQAPHGDAASPFNVTGAWGNSGSSTTPALNPSGMPGRLVGVAVNQILYISGTTGWACIAPLGGNPTQIVAGMRIEIGTGGGGTAPPTGNVEYTTVEEVHKIYPASGVTIGQIIYDAGSSGLCTVEPSAPMAGLTRNALIELASEYVRIISVTNGNNGISSFRCSTVGTNVTGDAITPPASGNIWVYLTLTHTTSEFLWQNVFQFQINPGSKGGQGSVYNNYAGSPYDMSLAGGRPVTPDDYMNVSIWCDHPEYLTQVQIVLDVDSNTTTSHQTVDGTRNAYIYTIKGSDLQQFVANLQTSDALRPGTIQDFLQAQTNVSYPTPLIPPSKLGSNQSSTPVDVASTAASNPPVPVLASTTSQLYTGESQWTELHFKLASFTRNGADQLTDLTQVRAILFNFVVSNSIFFSMAGMWIGGTYGPDVGNNLTPFIYRYRYRDSRTGVKSVPGPALRSGITAYRQGVQLIGTSSTDGQVDKLDWERLGGSNVDDNGNPDWHFLGTCDNSSPTLIDDQFSAAILPNDPLETDVYQPFTISAPPLTLTATVAGTAISVTSGVVNTNMVVGTDVIINGILTQVYAQPTSPTLFHVADSMGFGTGVKVLIQEPVLMNQPLPVMWGPFQNRLLACGNPLDAGSFYFTNSEDPDSAPDTNRLSVSSPSEMLMNGCVFDTKSYMWSDKRLFQITPTGDLNTPFSTNDIDSEIGLVNRWAFCVGPAIWYVAVDGVRQVGNGVVSQALRPLFPQGDKPGVAVNGINPINMSGPMRLTYDKGFVYFDYQDSTNAYHTFILDTVEGAWYWDAYFESGTDAIICRYPEYDLVNSVESIDLLVGGIAGLFYTVSGTSDNGLAINGEIDTEAFNAGDIRSFKQWGDLIIDLDTNNVTVNIVPWLNYYATALTGQGFITSTRTVSTPYNFGVDLFAQNLALKVTWSTTGLPPQVFAWEPSYLQRPEYIETRATDWDSDGIAGNKFLQGFILECDTNGLAQDILIQSDYTTVQVIHVNHSGQQMKPYTISPAFTGHMFRIIPQDPTLWRFFSVRWVWEPAPEFVTYWETQTTSHDLMGYQFLKDGYIAHTSTADITLTIQVDGINFISIIPNGGGLTRKSYLIFNGGLNEARLKGKLFKYTLQSANPFQLFVKDSEVRVHGWTGIQGLTGFGGYQVAQPFGDVSRVGGARI